MQTLGYHCKICLKYVITTHYYNSNLIWRTLSCRVDEIIPSDQSRREASRVSDGLTSSMRRDIVPQIKLLF